MQSAYPFSYIRTLTISHRLPCYMLSLIACSQHCRGQWPLHTESDHDTPLPSSFPSYSEPPPSQSPAKTLCILSQQVFVQISPSHRELLEPLYLKWNLHNPHLPTFCPQNMSITQIRYYFLSYSFLICLCIGLQALGFCLVPWPDYCTVLKGCSLCEGWRQTARWWLDEAFCFFPHFTSFKNWNGRKSLWSKGEK